MGRGPEVTDWRTLRKLAGNGNGNNGAKERDPHIMPKTKEVLVYAKKAGKNGKEARSGK